MREELSHIPNYTCLETISRFRKDPGSHPQSHGRLTALDTVRLEIVYTNHREWYGSPGDRTLSGDNPAAFIGSGMYGNGAFGSAPNNIPREASFTHESRESPGGRARDR